MLGIVQGSLGGVPGVRWSGEFQAHFNKQLVLMRLSGGSAEAQAQRRRRQIWGGRSRRRTAWST